MRARRIAAALTLGVAFATLAMALWLAGSRAGLHALLMLGHRLGGGALAIERSEGRLWGPLRLEGLTYRTADGAALALREFALNWRWRGGTLALAATANGLRYRPAAAAQPAAAPALPDIALPLPLAFDLAVTDIRLAGDQGETLLMDRLRLRGRVRGARWQELEVAAARGADRLALSGQLTSSGDWPLEFATSWHWAGAPNGALSGSGAVRGPALAPRLRLALAGWLHGSLEAELEDALAAPRWTLRAALTGTGLDGLAPALAGTEAVLEVAADGDLDSGHARGGLAVSGLHQVPLDAGFALAYRDDLLAIERLELTERGDGAQLALAGQVDLRVPTHPEFSVRAQLTAAARPLPDGRQLRHAEGDVQLTGTLDDYQLAADLRIGLDELPEVTLTLAGRGDRQQLQATTLNLVSGDAGLEGAGTLAWLPEPRWQGRWQLRNLDPALLAPAWPGRLSGTLHGSGRAGKPLQAQLRIEDLRGTLRGLPAAASGALTLDGERLDIADLQLALGTASLTAAGSVADHWRLRVAARAPELAPLLPDTWGALRLDAALSGPRRAPRMALDLELRDFQRQTLQATRLALRGSADLAPGGTLALELDGAQLHAGALAWSRLTGRLAGTREAHRLTLDAEGAPLAATAQLAGGLAADWRWRGELAALRLDAGDLGTWTLAAPASLALAADGVALSGSCLRSAPAELCAEVRAGSGGASGSLQLRELPGGFLGPWLPPGMALQTSFAGTAQWALAPGAAATANARLAVAPGAIVVPGAESPERIALDQGALQLALDGTGLAASAELALEGAGQFQGELRLPGWSLPAPPAAHQPVVGNLRLDTDALGLIDAQVAALEGTRGRLRADLTLAGTLAAPRFDGELRLDDGRTRLAQLGVELRDIALRVRGAPEGRIALEGELTSGKGRLHLDGWWQPATGTAAARLDGADFTVANTSELELDASPALRATLAERLVRVEGEVVIPRARIEPETLPEDAVNVSADVQIHDPAQPPPAAAAAYRVATDVRLRLGEDVRFAGFGLQGRPTGMIRVMRTPGRLARASGALTLEDASYTLRGRAIPITRGRVVYADSALDAPGIEVVARREIGEVTAGLRLRGAPQTPDMALFSTPRMPEADILSYLLLGRPLAATSAADAGLLMSAATSAGLSRGEDLAQSIGARFGLEEVRLESDGGLETTALVLGRYLTPRIYVRYLAGLTGAGQRVEFNYRITQRLEWQVESGEQTGTDLFYTIQRQPRALRSDAAEPPPANALESGTTEGK